ncbi:TadE/TadG family type IV pilus assembly protein [Neorhodopirellula pilleata]|uniref:TadE-like protein n=1 Tax=Neorhodopirellula pilleata TaxID=2714738 RepID=A0A5C5ZG15_9BACT|nr:TadE/TadG family type IV pilus assembly protein [Neorhodopirellula pilleata]TWT86060.1 TadE-like protein [Neorhodopirellula pilleata]
MLNHNSKQNRRKRLGATMVEFAVVTPILFTLLLAVFEFGWQVVIRHTADNAAYEAARKAIVPGGTAADAIEEANRVMGIVGARSFTVNVTPTVITEATRDIEVTVSGQYADNGIVAARFFNGLGFESRSKLLTERPRRD